MRFYITKSNEWMQYCSHQNCEQNPKYFRKKAKSGWLKKIKRGQVIGVIETGIHRSIYCRDCIDKVYAEFKAVFDTRLWAFH